MIKRSCLLLFSLIFMASCGIGKIPLATCTQDMIDLAHTQTSTYTPSDMVDFVVLEDGRFTIDDEVFSARGVNYYPVLYPWRRFLTESDIVVINQELTLLQEANLNTLRIFLWNEALFQCEGNGAVPQAEAFLRLDSIIHAAAEHDFRLIITLNDLPDLENYPLYNNPPHILSQTEFIVERYRDEGAILAWDMRNEGDIDYGTHPNIKGNFRRNTILNWLETTSNNIRAIDSNHLITAGWLFNAEATAPYVDFISFHHWTNANELQQRIETIRTETDKPILLQEVGYSTQEVSEERQAELLSEIISTSEEEGLLGWLVWTAFDFPIDATCYPSPCLSPDNREHYFGLWHSDYSPKPAAMLLGEI